MVGAYPCASGLASKPSLPIVFKGPSGGASPFPAPRRPAQGCQPSSQYVQGPPSLCILPECSDTPVFKLTFGQGLPRTLTLVPIWSGPSHRHLPFSGLGHKVFSHERERDIAQVCQSPRAGPCSVSCPSASPGKTPGTPGLSDQALHHHPWGVCQQASQHHPGYRPEGCLCQGAVLEKGPTHLLTEYGSLPCLWRAGKSRDSWARPDSASHLPSDSGLPSHSGFGFLPFKWEYATVGL